MPLRTCCVFSNSGGVDGGCGGGMAGGGFGEGMSCSMASTVSTVTLRRAEAAAGEASAVVSVEPTLAVCAASVVAIETAACTLPETKAMVI